MDGRQEESRRHVVEPQSHPVGSIDKQFSFANESQEHATPAYVAVEDSEWDACRDGLQKPT